MEKEVTGENRHRVWRFHNSSIFYWKEVKPYEVGEYVRRNPDRILPNEMQTVDAGPENRGNIWWCTFASKSPSDDSGTELYWPVPVWEGDTGRGKPARNLWENKGIKFWILQRLQIFLKEIEQKSEVWGDLDEGMMINNNMYLRMKMN